MTQNSVPTNLVRPEDLMQELGIKKDAYYADLNYLGIKGDVKSLEKAQSPKRIQVVSLKQA